MKVCVIGSGYVGLVTGACLAELGHEVVCTDKDEVKLNQLKSGKVPIYEPGLEELVLKGMKEGRLSFAERAPMEDKPDVVFIAVGTPEDDDGSADLRGVKEAAREIGQGMKAYTVVITKSTVPVGTGKVIRTWIAEAQPTPVDFDMVSNPEFLREGSAVSDFMNPDRIVVGAESPRAMEVMRKLYEPLLEKLRREAREVQWLECSLETAEMIKYASNAFLATKISFINEMANLCELVGADVLAVARGMGLDPRIGKDFLRAGPGFGGSCFPKDTKALVALARDRGYQLRIVEAVIQANRHQRERMAEKILSALGPDPAGKIVGCLGLTFKPGTDDMRHSPALAILPAIMSKGLKVRAHDPAGMKGAKALLPQVQMCADPYEALQGAHALVLMTEWPEYGELDWERIGRGMAERRIIDLRNFYKDQAEQLLQMGFSYEGVGRPGGGR